MIWTAISYNWSAAITSSNVFVSSHDHEVAVRQFKEEFIGENLLALIPGDHKDKIAVFPLLNPSFNSTRSNNDRG